MKSAVQIAGTVAAVALLSGGVAYAQQAVDQPEQPAQPQPVSQIVERQAPQLTEPVTVLKEAPRTAEPAPVKEPVSVDTAEAAPTTAAAVAETNTQEQTVTTEPTQAPTVSAEPTSTEPPVLYDELPTPSPGPHNQ